MDAVDLPKEGVKPTMREYTPRRIDLVNNELDLDFVLHGDGPASTWAAQAKPGHTLNIAGPRGSLVVPDIFDSYLLVGDETAIPAIGRRLEELSAGRKVLAVIEIEDAQERQPLPSKADVHVIWVERHAQSVLEVLAGLQLPAGELYAWVALEKALTRKAKALLLEENGVADDRLKAAAYWRLDPHDDE